MVIFYLLQEGFEQPDSLNDYDDLLPRAVNMADSLFHAPCVLCGKGEQCRSVQKPEKSNFCKTEAPAKFEIIYA